jgi:hypothetical protein
MNYFPAVIKLENIGDDYYWARGKSQLAYKRYHGPARPPSYATRLVWNGQDIEKQFLKGQKDYSKANSVGSRGVETYYILQPGWVYEVHEHLTWKRSRTYWCRVEDGMIIEMTFEEALAWLVNAVCDQNQAVSDAPSA